MISGHVVIGVAFCVGRQKLVGVPFRGLLQGPVQESYTPDPKL
jgi:hypothetical protein